MKFFMGTLSVVVLALTMSASLAVSAFNDNQEACSIPTSEFLSLIQSIDHAKENFIFGTDELVPRMWWGGILGLNDSLDEPFQREELERIILELRERERIIPELSLFLRTRQVWGERNAEDFFLLVSHLCEEGLVTRAEIHTDSAIRRAHRSLGDTHSLYLNPAEAARYLERGIVQVEERGVMTSGLAHTEQLGTNIYLVKIDSLSRPEVASDVRNALELIVEVCPSPHIILDLRNNTGGSAGPSIDVARSFLRNQTVTHFEYKNGLRVSFTAQNQTNGFDLASTTVLINQWTASGAEIITAALDENGATTVGSKTYGKGVGQYAQPLTNGGTSRITSFWVFSPLGNSWHGVGITPDVDPAAHLQTPAGASVALEMLSGLGDFYFDTGVVASYRFIREDPSWHERCEP